MCLGEDMDCEQLPKYSNEGDLILVVDDDHLIRRIVCDTLKLSGFNIIEASNGQQAVDLFDAQQPALVILDLMMPIVDGYETCKVLRQRVPDLALPIIMLTTLDDVEAINKAFLCGASDFISKPFNPNLLAMRIRSALRDRSMYMDLKEQQRRLADTQRIAKIGYGQINLSQGRISISKEIAEMLGMHDMCEASLQDFAQLLAGEDRSRMFAEIEKALSGGGGYAFEHRLTTTGGDKKVMMQRGEIKQRGKDIVVEGTLQDVTEQARAEERILFHTYYDVLTNLPNRLMFEKHIQEQIQPGQQLAVMFIGIDRFKGINDALGHGFGDKLLKQVAERLLEVQDFGITLSRFGGDLFVLGLSNYGAIDTVNEIAENVLHCFDQPVILNGLELKVTASLGIATFPQEADCADKLILGADTAMNHAKAKGGAQYRYFTTAMDAQAQERLALEHDLRHAVRRREFEIYYQPQVDVKRGRVIGMEALLRWNHPTRGVILPAQFIGLAEETGLISEIGEWVLQTACSQTRKWIDAGHDHLRVGVNLSVKQLEQPNLSADILHILSSSGLAPELLELEITESMAVAEFENTSRTLEQIRNLGVQTSMDDFGTGYSALSYLQKLPLDTLKIDRAFIKDINEQGENGEIAKAIIAMAHSIGLHVIAEGIETEHQYRYLVQQHCNEIQGYYVSRPLPAFAVEPFLKRTNCSHDTALSLVN